MNFVLLCWSRRIGDGWGLLSDQTCPIPTGLGLLLFQDSAQVYFFPWGHLGIKLNKTLIIFFMRTHLYLTRNLFTSRLILLKV